MTRPNQTEFTPPILMMTVVAMFVMFRSWRITLFTLFAVLVSVLWEVGSTS